MQPSGRVSSTSIIALVGPDGAGRRDLARYLEASGFDVSLVEPPPPASAASLAMVWLTERDDNPIDSADTIASWLDAVPARRAIVVTWRPAAFRAAFEAHDDRLAVLVAPVFGWQISDALRSLHRGGAR